MRKSNKEKKNRKKKKKKKRKKKNKNKNNKKKQEEKNNDNSASSSSSSSESSSESSSDSESDSEENTIGMTDEQRTHWRMVSAGLRKAVRVIMKQIEENVQPSMASVLLNGQPQPTKPLVADSSEDDEGDNDVYDGKTANNDADGGGDADEHEDTFDSKRLSGRRRGSTTRSFSRSSSTSSIKSPGSFRRARSLESQGSLADISDSGGTNSSGDRNSPAMVEAANLRADGDPSVFQGSLGYAFMYLRLYHSVASAQLKEQYLRKGYKFVAHAALQSQQKRMGTSFLLGYSGLLAMTAVYDAIGLGDVDAPEVQRSVQLLLSFWDHVIKDRNSELLHGRSGYLFALLFVHRYLGDAAIDRSLLKRMARRILRTGENEAQRAEGNAPILFKWQGQYYMGAAHGLIGALHVCLHAPLSADSMFLVKGGLRYLMNHKFASGNYPTVDGDASSSSRDYMVQWCHGAPGAVILFCKAFEVLGDMAYLNEAKAAGEVVWQRGLLRKGPGKSSCQFD
eukprot:TRINITY_DN65877_c10_g2_i2.p1 TRINITY_DN65877_c10_g2~~TRINITY_DN65877_c10_g2_i2.p1  ORF type:complete len:575 (-),score=266.62 TRINITY_DN65877_c10_g2_i2:459-1985(-)